VSIDYLNLGGFGFSDNTKRVYKKYQEYNAIFRATTPHDVTEAALTIAISDICEKGDGGRSYRAIYRSLTKEQTSTLAQIAEMYANIQPLRVVTIELEA
jgi:hypothetical protein